MASQHQNSRNEVADLLRRAVSLMEQNNENSQSTDSSNSASAVGAATGTPDLPLLVPQFFRHRFSCLANKDQVR